jgi:membrane protease YdiL (CAAX protease family)
MNITTKTNQHNFLPTILRIVLVLAAIQMFRAVVYRVLMFAGMSPVDDITNAASILLTGLTVLILFKSGTAAVGLDNFPRSKVRFFYYAGYTLLFVLAGINLYLNPSQIIPTLISCLIFPLFEEPLFRGWIWNRVTTSLPSRWNGPLAVLVTAALFALWHLGYWDVVALHVPAGLQLLGMIHIMLMKMMITSIIGLICGLLRWKTGNIYASILFHAFWNLFGR